MMNEESWCHTKRSIVVFLLRSWLLAKDETIAAETPACAAPAQTIPGHAAGKGTVKTQPQSQHQLSSPSPETIGKWPAGPPSSIWDIVLERSTKQGLHQKIINPQHKNWKTASDVIKCGDPLPHQMPFSSPSSFTGGAQGCHTHKLAPWGALFWKGWS